MTGEKNEIHFLYAKRFDCCNSAIDESPIDILCHGEKDAIDNHLAKYPEEDLPAVEQCSFQIISSPDLTWLTTATVTIEMPVQVDEVTAMTDSSYDHNRHVQLREEFEEAGIKMELCEETADGAVNLASTNDKISSDDDGKGEVNENECPGYRVKRMLRITDDEEIYRCARTNATAMSKDDGNEPVDPFWDGYQMLKIVDKLEDSDLATMTPTGTSFTSKAVKQIEDSFLCELEAVATAVVNVRANKDKILDILAKERGDDASEVEAISEISAKMDSESCKSVNMVGLVDADERRFPEEPKFNTREVVQCHIDSFNSRNQGSTIELVGRIGTDSAAIQNAENTTSEGVSNQADVDKDDEADIENPIDDADQLSAEELEKYTMATFNEITSEVDAIIRQHRPEKADFFDQLDLNPDLDDKISASIKETSPDWTTVFAEDRSLGVNEELCDKTEPVVETQEARMPSMAEQIVAAFENDGL